MATQNKSNYQSTVSSLSPDNATGEVSPSDLRTLCNNLSDSVLHTKASVENLGSNPTTWGVGNFHIANAKCEFTTSGAHSIDITNTVDLGNYTIRIGKNVAGDVNLTITSSGLTVFHPNNESTIDLKGDNGDDYLIEIKRRESNIYVYTSSILPLYQTDLLDEDNIGLRS